MNELALFAGAGGGILASEIIGDRTVCAVELDGYAASILARRQNDGLLPPFPIWSDVRTFDGRCWKGIVDSVAGGFPCQDISIAGKGEGLDGARSGLWAEFRRIICEVEPAIVRVENSPMLASRGLNRVLGDLASLGFDAEWDVVSAADLGAWHLRERLWIVAAHPDRQRELQREGRESDERGRIGDCTETIADISRKRHGIEKDQICAGRHAFVAGSKIAPDARSARLQGAWTQQDGPDRWQAGRSLAADHRWPAEPELVRMVHGIPNRVDRIRALGNAQVPRVAAAAFAVLQRELMT